MEHIQCCQEEEIGTEEKCIKSCITRRWKYPGLRVGQGLEPFAVFSGEGQSGVTVIVQKQTSHCEVAGSVLFLGVGSEPSPRVSWSPTCLWDSCQAAHPQEEWWQLWWL